LKINFGHFGGDKGCWIDKVAEMISDDNYKMYADISFYMSGLTFFNGKKEKADYTYSSAIKKVLKNPKCLKKILYGSDYYPAIIGLCDSKGEYQTYFDIVKDCLSDENNNYFNIISSLNPKEFLGIGS
jgi:predicted TIM-barrel fold metal-dependent hydrolase